MATRGRHQREDGGGKEFTGRVRRWTRTWVTSKQPKTKELKFRRWMQTDERPPELAGPRHSYIVPLKDPDAQPYPQHRMLLPGGAPGGVLPASAALGAPGMKRGKSQASLAANGTAGSGLGPGSQQQPAASAGPAAGGGGGAAAAPAPKFKLKFTLGQRLDAATAGMEASSGFQSSASGLVPSPSTASAAAAGASAGGAAHPPATAHVPPPGTVQQSSPFPTPAGVEGQQQQYPAQQQQQQQQQQHTGVATPMQLDPPPPL